MKQYILPVLGATAVGVGVAWLLTTSVTLAYRGVKGPTTLAYQATEEKVEKVEKVEKIDEKVEEKIPPSPPAVTARAYLLADLNTGETIIGRGAKTAYPIASITKLMTALISLEVMNQANLVAIDGEKLAVGDLLYPLLLESSNEAAEAMAQAYGRDRFIALMNDKARDLNLKQTAFADPSGISEGNRSTAEDLARFLEYLYREASYPLNVTQLPQKRLGRHLWLNNNRLVRAAGFLGGKTGKTVPARQTLASIIELPLPDGTSRPIALVLLQSDDREGDAAVLMEYLQTILPEQP